MKRMVKANSSVVFDLPAALMQVADKYNGVSKPISGDWETETEAEMNDIAEAFNISTDTAKALMVYELGFDWDMFDSAY